MEPSATPSNAFRLAIGIAVGLGAAALAIAVTQSPSPDIAKGLVAKVDSSLYQAVQLASGTVYYGKASEVDGAIDLSDVYYLTGATASNPSGSLVKRGAEIDAPTGDLLINPADVVSLENVGSNSLISRGIKRLQTGDATTTTSTVTTTSTPVTSTSAAR